MGNVTGNPAIALLPKIDRHSADFQVVSFLEYNCMLTVDIKSCT